MTYEEFVVSYENLMTLMFKHSSRYHPGPNPYPKLLGKLVDEFPEFDERYDMED